MGLLPDHMDAMHPAYNDPAAKAKWEAEFETKLSADRQRTQQRDEAAMSEAELAEQYREDLARVVGQRHIEKARKARALAPNTVTRYRRANDRWAAWCRENGVNPRSPDPAIAAAYLIEASDGSYQSFLLTRTALSAGWAAQRDSNPWDSIYAAATQDWMLARHREEQPGAEDDPTEQE